MFGAEAVELWGFSLNRVEWLYILLEKRSLLLLGSSARNKGVRFLVSCLGYCTFNLAMPNPRVFFDIEIGGRVRAKSDRCGAAILCGNFDLDLHETLLYTVDLPRFKSCIADFGTSIYWIYYCLDLVWGPAGRIEMELFAAPLPRLLRVSKERAE